MEHSGFVAHLIVMYNEKKNSFELETGKNEKNPTSILTALFFNLLAVSRPSSVWPAAVPSNAKIEGGAEDAA